MTDINIELWTQSEHLKSFTDAIGKILHTVKYETRTRKIFLLFKDENTDFRKNYTISHVHDNWLIIVRRGKVKKRVIEYYKQDYTAQKDIVVWKRDLCSNKLLKTYIKHYGDV